MGFNNYTFAALIHITSALLYQNTGTIEYLYLSLALIAWSTLMFMLGVAYLISPEHEVEVSDEMYKVMSDYSNRGALQLTVFLIAYILYTRGYELVSGIIAFQAAIVLLSCLVSSAAQGRVKK